jgi:hypothetical protein
MPDIAPPVDTTVTPPAPAATPPAPAPAAASQAPRVAHPAVPPGDEPWKGERAKREARQYLKAFGIKVGKNDDIAQVAAAHREKSEKRKNELSELRKKVPELENRMTAADTALKVHAEQSLATLPEAAQASIKALATRADGTLDTVKTLELIATARAVQAGAPPATAPARAPVPPGANTTVSGAPPPPATTNETNHKVVYQKLRDENPLQAAQYARRYEREIFDSP